jgi:DNA-binding NtrC family response regulator
MLLFGKEKMAHILLVDDQPYIGEFLSEELADGGHQIACVRQADRVMSALEESHPDMVLLDLYLDGFEGWDLLDKIKNHDPSLPVLIVSAYDSFRNDPRLSRADGYVIKSFNTDHLRQKIHETLTNH